MLNWISQTNASSSHACWNFILSHHSQKQMLFWKIKQMLGYNNLLDTSFISLNSFILVKMFLAW